MNAAIALTSGMRQNLFAIQRTSKLLSANATRLNTGRKINSALDNPVSFFTALEHTNRARDLMMRKAEMGEGIQTISAASTGIDSMLEMIDSAEALAKSALSAGSSEEVEALANQYNETLNQITAVACDASYKGVGLLRCPPESMTINFDEAGDSSLTVEGECATATGLGLNEVDLDTEIVPEDSIVNDGHAYSCPHDLYMMKTTINVLNPDAITTPVEDFQIAYHTGKPIGTGGAENVHIDIAVDRNRTPTASFEDFTVHYDSSSGTWSITNGDNPTGAFPNASISAESTSNYVVIDLDNTPERPIIRGYTETNLTEDSDITFDIFDDIGIVKGLTDYPDAVLTRPSWTNFQIDLDGNGSADIDVNWDRSGPIIEGLTINFFIEFDLNLPVNGITWSSPSGIQTSLDELKAAKERLRTLQQKLSTNLSIITTRSSFTDAMVNVLETGASNLTNADMNEEGANALMLQTQQSLGMTSLTMASQAAQSVLRLFS